MHWNGILSHGCQSYAIQLTFAQCTIVNTVYLVHVLVLWYNLLLIIEQPIISKPAGQYLCVNKYKPPELCLLLFYMHISTLHVYSDVFMS